jgi:predicted nucleic acid-binding protein
MAERAERGLLDTSVVIDLDSLPEEALPLTSAISTVTLAELAAGLHTTNDAGQRAARAMRLQTVEATIDALPLDSEAARWYGQLVALVLASGRSPRPRRLDLLIAATAAADRLPLYTRNAGDLAGLGSVLTIVDVDEVARESAGDGGGGQSP